MKFLRALALVTVGTMVLIVGSCTAIGVSTGFAVNTVFDNVEEFAASETAKKWERKRERDELRDHNEQINRESALDSTHEEYDNYE